MFGTLCHAPLRDVVMGGETKVEVKTAKLRDHAVHWAGGADHPMLVAAPGEVATGVVVTGMTREQRARFDFFEGGFDYDLVPALVDVDGAEVMALRYDAPAGVRPGGRWRLVDWAETYAPLWVAAAEEAMSYFGQIGPEVLAARMGMIRLRAAARLRAEEGLPATLRSDMEVASDVEIETFDRPYSHYFVTAEADLRFRRFDGTMSATVNRAGFVMGDAVTVLPYDPVHDLVLLVEQFRMGPMLRGDARPWMLEPIAGRVDPGEAPDTTARRETLEEARLTLGKLHFVNGHYPSPGAVTEFVYSYVGEARLQGRGGDVAGLVTEDENIRSHVIPFDQLMELVRSGEAAAGPLVISAFWLALNRARLRGSA
nr:NUDIX domain-containing protein [Maritimibacter sp. DP1N21-5]